jgi:3',5'-cyclic AMP phosphodiesterase CpdA
VILAQISDLHVGEADGPALGHLADCAARLNALAPQPDVVLITGDLADNGRPEEYERVKSQLDRVRARVLAVPGNRDHRLPMRRILAGILPVEEGSPFLHYAVEDYPLRLIGLDSLNPPKAGGRLCALRLGWLESTLAMRPTAPAFIFLHHAPLPARMRDGSIGFQLEGREELAALLARHPQVAGMAGGHLHHAYASRFAGVPVSTAPSVAYQGQIDRTHPPGHPHPPVQLHYWGEWGLTSRLD